MPLVGSRTVTCCVISCHNVLLGVVQCGKERNKIVGNFKSAKSWHFGLVWHFTSFCQQDTGFVIVLRLERNTLNILILLIFCFLTAVHNHLCKIPSLTKMCHIFSVLPV